MYKHLAMNAAETYRTLTAPSEGLYKEKGSKFLAFAYPVADESQIQSHIESLKSQYYDARHHCYAYALGEKRQKFRYNDDGEPSGTAGKPIYGQILAYDLTYVLIVVVRYFGGTLLGTGGLVQAYKTAAANALQNAQIVEHLIGRTFRLRFDYTLLDRVKYLLKNSGVEITGQIFDVSCQLECKAGIQSYDNVIQQLKQWGKVEIIEPNQQYH